MVLDNPKRPYRTVLASLAEAGFLAIGVDGIGHCVNANFQLVVFPTIILMKASPLQERDGHSHQDNETDFTS